MTGIPLRRSAQIVGVGDLDDATVLDIRPKVLEILDAAELAHDREQWKARITEKVRREVARDSHAAKDGQRDNLQNAENKLPLNSDVRDLCLYLKAKRTNFATNIECVRDFCRVNKINNKRPEALLRQAQRFPHLWRQ